MEDINDVQVQVVAEQNADEFDFDEDVEIIQDYDEELIEEQAPKKQKQSSQDNAIAKAARLEAEKRQREAEQKYQEVLKKFGVSNEEELNQLSYELTDAEKDKYTEEAEDRGLDVDDYLERKLLMKMMKAQQAEKAAQHVKKTLDEESKKLAQRDIEDFNEEYPNIDADALMKDERFKEFAEDRFGKKTLIEIYESYKRVTGMKDDEVRARTASRASRSTGTASKNGEKYVLTSSQAKELKAWNDANPTLKMTVKEFLNK